MKAVTKLLAGGIGAAALFSAAPAAAQYYPGYPGYGAGNVVTDVINQVLGGGYGGYPGYGQDSRFVVSQCVGAVQARLHSQFSYGGGYANPYAGYPGYSNARVLGISRVEPRSSGGVTVRGVATSGMNAGYGTGYRNSENVDLTFRCRADYRGYIVDIDIDRAEPAYGGYNYNYTPNYTPPYNPNDPYAAYGYRRY